MSEKRHNTGNGQRLKTSAAAKAAVPEAQLEEQLSVGLMRMADALGRGADALLKPMGLSGTQYNVLRILRGAGPQGLACSAVGCRMISRDPDITRLLDRIERRGLISRARGERDRRVVTTYITEEGLRTLAALDEPVREFHRRKFGHLPPAKLRELSRLLEMARGGGEHEAEAPGGKVKNRIL